MGEADGNEIPINYTALRGMGEADGKYELVHWIITIFTFEYTVDDIIL